MNIALTDYRMTGSREKSLRASLAQGSDSSPIGGRAPGKRKVGFSGNQSNAQQTVRVLICNLQISD
jgi:hypothetical protein